MHPLDAALRKLNMSANELARRLTAIRGRKTYHVTVCEIIKGTRNASPSMALAIERALDGAVSAADIVLHGRTIRKG